MFDYSNKHCAKCGNLTLKKIPEGDHKPREVCSACGHIHYVNPKVIVGTLPVSGNKVLLCKRNIEPRLGYWTLPAGFMELNETSGEGAARETWEEAEAKLDNMQFYRIIDLPDISQIYMFYTADLLDEEFNTTPESSEVALFEEHEIPWNNMAFVVVSRLLKEYFEDRKKGQFTPKQSVLRRKLQQT